ncbi:MAG TPA: hypothetical protein VGO35_00560 [Gammaproteobacteria bacterium]|jgi:hypothetical protein|nr:hypothetical protein [Gammaproteobacteria bacterium]
MQIHLRLREIWQSWYNRAMEGGTKEHPALSTLCLDPALLRDGTYREPAADQFELVDPLAMNYIPAPLDFVCNTCGRFEGYDSLRSINTNIERFAQRNCDSKFTEHRGTCRWRQLDVIFVHWSGTWLAPTPGRWEWSVDKQELQRPFRSCAVCKSTKFYLVDKSPRIGEWVFECENGHKDGDSWLQNDPATTQLLGDECKIRPPRWRRMEPISYRATPAFYPHSEQFVVIAPDQRDLLLLLQEGNETSLERFAADRFGIGEKPLSDEEVLDHLRRIGESSKVSLYEFIKETISEFRGKPMEGQARDRLTGMMRDWRNTSGLLPTRHEAPPWLDNLIRDRPLYGRRYDPLALAVEHEALARSVLRRPALDAGRSPFVRFDNPDPDVAPRAAVPQDDDRKGIESAFGAMGIDEMGLIREFDLCRFTHGFTRMSTDPLIEKSDQQQVRFPVRLNLFQTLGNDKIPIYVVTQANEAIYVRLSSEAVCRWLGEIGVDDQASWKGIVAAQLGAHILQTATPFGKFFSQLNPGPANSYRYVYTLLHTYSHAFMKAIAEFSGLDLGSLGEYVFPADMAFVVYRNGTTMDLGNLSALWRNYGTEFLEHLLQPKTLLCGAGSLCDSSGGACPSCIVVPETSCIAANQLLSRSVLRFGPAPREDSSHTGSQIPGFLDVCMERCIEKPRGQVL